MKKKRLLAALFASLILSCAGFVFSACNDGVTDEASGKGLRYKLNADGKSYTVTGFGLFIDTDVVISSTYDGFPVTGIGNGAFSDCRSLTSVVIPDRESISDLHPTISC